MKRGIAATVILLFCITFALTVNMTLYHQTEKMYILAQSAVENPSSFSAFENEWEKQSLFFSLFTDHNCFEVIEKQIEKIHHFKNDIYRDACIEITAVLAQIKTQFSYSFSNVF